MGPDDGVVDLGCVQLAVMSGSRWNGVERSRYVRVERLGDIRLTPMLEQCLLICEQSQYRSSITGETASLTDVELENRRATISRYMSPLPCHVCTHSNGSIDFMN